MSTASSFTTLQHLGERLLMKGPSNDSLMATGTSNGITTTECSPLLQKVKGSQDTRLQCHQVSRSTRHYILGALWAGTFFCNLNLTMVATLLPAITSEFKGSNQASWIGTAYLLSSCSFTPLYGRLCAILGRRAACQIALTATALGTLLCGISRNMVELSIARFIAGVGAGALQLLAMIVSADLYSIRDLGLPQAFSSLSLALGLGLGGPIGGILNDLFGWRIAFLCQVPPFVMVTIVATNTLCYVTPGQGQSAIEILSRIDFGGLITFFLMIGSTLTWLSTKFNDDLPWTDPQVVIPLILSLLFLALLFVVECYIAPEPIFPPSLFREKVPVLVSLSNYFASVCNFSVMYFIPLWFETVALDSASIAGFHLLPHSLAMGLGSLMGGWFIHRTGKYVTLNVIFGLLPLSGLIPIILMREDSGFIPKWMSVFPIGFGNAVMFLTVLIAMQAHLPESSIPIGTAISQLFRGLGQISSVAIATAVFQSRLDVELRERIHIPDAERIISEIRHSLSLVRSLPPDLQRATRDAYASSLRTVFVVATFSLLVSYVLRLPIPEAAAMKEKNASTRPVDVESELHSHPGARM
ncbi:major facilitator superfamily domain-containing protein [Boletus edulis]|nr:major facilitator superfamily domain-containing protein [Boletus edulis]